LLVLFDFVVEFVKLWFSPLSLFSILNVWRSIELAPNVGGKIESVLSVFLLFLAFEVRGKSRLAEVLLELKIDILLCCMA